MASGLTGITQGVKVAVFVIVLSVAGWLVYRWVAKDGRPGKTYAVYTHLNDATGLVTKSRVKIAGIPVGYIDEISLDQGKAKVRIVVDEGVPIFHNGAAAKRASSLLGEYNLVIIPGTAEAPKVKDGEEIPAVDAATTDKIMQDVAVIAEKVKLVATQAASAFGTDESGKQMKELVKNLAEVSKELNETVKENRQAVKATVANIEKITNVAVPKVNAILTNVEHVTSDFKTILEGDKSKAPPGSGMADVKDTLAHVKEASKSLETTMKHTESVIGRLDRGEGTFGRLSKDETLINEVEGVVGDVREFTSGIARVQTIIGLRNEYLLRANGFKSFFELRLQPREDKYYMVELISDPRGMTTVTQIDTTSSDPYRPALNREVRTETRNTLRFSFMFARRLGPATFLFGIRESTGGLGVTLHALDDRLELRSDIFGFGENIRPRWREHLSYEFVRRLWVVLGVDDILNDARTDYFFGAQLRFNDEDLKTILPFVSVRP
ncbi:MAG: MCE family protein [Deltaproteobacteria bacterium]|nr:MCE family protein [Deltaproteobacteria bacterium]